MRQKDFVLTLFLQDLNEPDASSREEELYSFRIRVQKLFFYSFFSLLLGFLCWLFWQAHDSCFFPRGSWVPTLVKCPPISARLWLAKTCHKALVTGGVGAEVPQPGSQSTGCISQVDSSEDYTSMWTHSYIFFFLYHTVMGSALGIKIEIGKSLYKLKSVNSATLSGN